MCLRGVMKHGCVHLENMKCEKGVCHGKLHARKVCVFYMDAKRMCGFQDAMETCVCFGREM